MSLAELFEAYENLHYCVPSTRLDWVRRFESAWGEYAALNPALSDEAKERLVAHFVEVCEGRATLENQA